MASNAQKGIIAAALGASAAALAYSVLVEPYAIETVELDLFCPRLPAAFDGYKILQLSDFHTRKFGRREQSILEKVAAFPKQDLILITGDLIHTPRGTEPFVKLCSTFSASDGIYAVFGNSEHKNGVRSLDLASEIKKVGVTSLINQHVVIERSGSSICLAGVDDPVSLVDDLPAALKGVPDEQFKLLMMHSPDPIGLAAAFGVDVVLSGHTHGGQVSIPFLGPIHTNSMHGPEMSCGLYVGENLFRIIGFRPGRTKLYVTRGIGISGLALRFNCRPEITRITLRRSRQDT